MNTLDKKATFLNAYFFNPFFEIAISSESIMGFQNKFKLIVYYTRRIPVESFYPNSLEESFYLNSMEQSFYLNIIGQ